MLTDAAWMKWKFRFLENLPIGMCTLEPIVEVFDRDDNKTTYVLVDAKKAKEIAKEHLKNDKIIDEYTIGHYKK